MPLCSSCYQYVSEKSCPNCGATDTNLISTLTPKRIDLKSLSINSIDHETEENTTFSVKRKVSVIASNRNKKIQFLNLPWIHSNNSNTNQWLEFTRVDTENDSQLKFRLDTTFFTPSQESGQLNFGRPVQEIKFQLSDAFILLYPDPRTANNIIEQLSEMNLFYRPVYFIGSTDGLLEDIVPYQVSSWRNAQIMLTSLAEAIVQNERNVAINFQINTPQQRRHLNISDVVERWDGIPTIKILDVNSGSLNEKRTLPKILKPYTKILSSGQEYGKKCLGHGQKLPEDEIFAFCEECKGPICKNCYHSFETICPGSLFTNNHYLPSLN